MFISFIDSTTNEELFDRLDGLHIEDVPGLSKLTINTAHYNILLRDGCKWDTILLYTDSDKPIEYKYDIKKHRYMGPCIEAIKNRMNPRSCYTTFTYEQSRTQLAEIIRYLMVA